MNTEALEKENMFCEEILREQYTDYDKNKWHYEREFKMLKIAYEKGVVFTMLTWEGKPVADTSGGLHLAVVNGLLPKEQDLLCKLIDLAIGEINESDLDMVEFKHVDELVSESYLLRDKLFGNNR